MSAVGAASRFDGEDADAELLAQRGRLGRSSGARRRAGPCGPSPTRESRAAGRCPCCRRRARRSSCRSSTHDSARGRASACARSAIRSSACSSPIETRSRFCGVVEPGPSLEARCSIRLSVPPRLVALTKSFTREAARTAASRPPRTRKESIPPKPDICRFAIAWPGCDSRPGIVDRLDGRMLLEEARDARARWRNAARRGSESERRPRSTSQELNGEATAPEDLADVLDLRARARPPPRNTSAPPCTSLWPPRYFVVE